ncbi:unnamed protein product [Didymodactylos carnosus]|uniref:Uncharacterized protein n=1 Tax=Didymodactylos carnosus TaxID=1234261 RepID=A0A816CVZ3_9BILA|nr:unnamed protein product [Didymodactylos carnosus]CAF4518873.1 unnamed protein product [Didymodactylos carnosus]
MDINEGFEELHRGNGWKGTLKIAQGAGFMTLDLMTLGTLSTAVRTLSTASVRLGMGAAQVAGKLAAREFMTIAERKAMEHVAKRCAAVVLAKSGAYVTEKVGETVSDAMRRPARSQQPSANQSQSDANTHEQLRTATNTPKLKSELANR